MSEVEVGFLKFLLFSCSAELVMPNKLGHPSLIWGNFKKMREALLNDVECIKMRGMT